MNSRKDTPVYVRRGPVLRRPPLRGGWVLAEAVVSVVLLGLLIGSFTVLQSSAAALNEVQVARQRCILAAQAQLDSLTATGREIEPSEVARCWPGVRTEVRREAGAGDWQGLTLASVTATARAGGRSVQVEFARYLAPEAAGGAP